MLYFSICRLTETNIASYTCIMEHISYHGGSISDEAHEAEGASYMAQIGNNIETRQTQEANGQPVSID